MALVSACLAAGHGCSITVSESLAPDPSNVVALVTFDLDNGDFRDQRTGTFHARADESDAVVGTLALWEPPPLGPALVPLTGRRDGARFSFDPVRDWETFELTVLDLNGDGFACDGTGIITGDMNGSLHQINAYRRTMAIFAAGLTRTGNRGD